MFVRLVTKPQRDGRTDRRSW